MMLRLTGVVGNGTLVRRNNLLFFNGPDKSTTGEINRQHVVFFPGDVQNYKTKMTSSFHHAKWANWSYEDTAKLLASQFPYSWIWVIEPYHMHDDTFSCYDNFVKGNLLGAPESFDNCDALLHLQELLKSAVNLVNSHIIDETEQEHVCEVLGTSKKCPGFSAFKKTSGKDDVEGVGREVKKDVAKQGDKIGKMEIKPGIKSDVLQKSHKEVADEDGYVVKINLPVVLVGFSKGCVVLNQFLHELNDAQADNPELKHFVKSISAWYWLDGGHSKESDTWITNEDVLNELVKLKTPINVCVTPYQMKDANRPYIGEEEKLFVNTLKKLGADVKETLHFDDEKRSLENHFKILEKISVVK